MGFVLGYLCGLGSGIWLRAMRRVAAAVPVAPAPDSDRIIRERILYSQIRRTDVYKDYIEAFHKAQGMNDILVQTVVDRLDEIASESERIG